MNKSDFKGFHNSFEAYCEWSEGLEDNENRLSWGEWWDSLEENSMTKLQLEINKRFVIDGLVKDFECPGILVTPPLNAEYWMYRVSLYRDQAIVGFPKFATIVIGFAIENGDWNTTLSYTSDAEEICEHIWHNREYVAIKKKRTIHAIEMIKDFVTKLNEEN